MPTTMSLSVWESNVNIANNTSVVTAVASVTTTGESWNGYGAPGTMVIDGTTYNFSKAFYQNQTTEIARFSKTVTHNADGAKSVNVTCTFHTGISAGTLTRSQNLTLTTIPRAATIRSISWTDMEEAFNVSYSAPSSGFAYKLRVSIPNVQTIVTYSNYSSGTSKSLTLAEKTAIYQYMVSNRLSNTNLGFVIETWSGSTKIGESVEVLRTISQSPFSTLSTDANYYNAGSPIAITIRRSNAKYTHKLTHVLNNTNLATTNPGVSETYSGVTLDAFGKQYPNSMSGILTLTLETYYNTVLLGVSNKMLTISMPAYNPNSPTLSVSVVNSNATVQGWGIYLRGYSKYKATISNAQGYYSSTIKEYIFNGNPQSENVYNSGYLNVAGKFKIAGAIKDTRNRTSATVTKEITVVDYDRPYITNLWVARSDGTNDTEEGNRLRVFAYFGFSSCDGRNSATCDISIRPSSGGAWTKLGAISNGINKIFTNVDMQINVAYDVKATLTDTVGVVTTKTATITTASAVIDVLKGGKGVAIGKMASAAGYMEVDFISKFNKNIITDGGAIVIRNGEPNTQSAMINIGYKGTSYYYAMYLEANNALSLHTYDNGAWKSNPLQITNTGLININGNARFNGLVNTIKREDWWVNTDKHNVDDLHGAVTFAYSSHNAPTGGTIASFVCNDRQGYDLQLMGSYSGNTLYFRNHNGDRKTWNPWQRLVTTDEAVMAQSINLADGAWSWVKYTNGISVCWRNFTSQGTWTAWGNLSEKMLSASIPYPSGLFISAPSFCCGGAYADSESCMVEYNNGGSSTQTPSVYAVRPQGATGTNWTRSSMFAIGRWK